MARVRELLFKLLAPMHNVTAMDNCAREEAAYWPGMAMHLLLSAN